MRKCLLVIMGLTMACLMSSCYETRKVTSYNQHYVEILSARDALSKMGYELSGEDTRTDNNVYVSAVSYSNKTGYGSALGNNYITTDRYTFTDTCGNTMSYSVSYELHNSSDEILYVTNVTVPQCETSNPKEYTRMCGYNSPIRDITNVPKSTSVKIYNALGTEILGYTISAIALIGLICILGGSEY